MNYWSKIEEIIKKAPKTPGVYVFYENRKILYIGKASSLKNRLKSYLKSGDFKNDRLHENATNLKLILLRSEIEALIEEAKLIKEHDPPYNVLWRDDKTYFYAAVTEDKFPRIFVVHKNQLNSRFKILDSIAIGPFTDGRALRLVLKMLRRYFPYCTCPKSHLRICLNAQIGNCQGFCCEKNKKATVEQIKTYSKNIKIIKNLILGKPLKGFAKTLKQEERSALEKILAHREFLENFDSAIPEHFEPRTPNYLIEGFDISHLSGKETVAGMTAWNFQDDKLSPRKDFWRKFIIRTAKLGDDPAAMTEAVFRRLGHPEWPFPDLMVIDGGIGQFGAAQKATHKSGIVLKKTRIISFAKPVQIIYGFGENPLKLSDAPENIKKIIPRVVIETHNFAVRFHRQRRKKNFIKQNDIW